MFIKKYTLIIWYLVWVFPIEIDDNQFQVKMNTGAMLFNYVTCTKLQICCFFYYYTARYDQYDQNKIIHAQILSYFRKGIPLKKKTPVGYKQQSILKIEVREFLIFSSHHFTFYSVQSCNALFQPINLQLLKIQNQEIPYWTIEGILFCKETT